jgi:hypothetical protein
MLPVTSCDGQLREVLTKPDVLRPVNVFAKCRQKLIEG